MLHAINLHVQINFFFITSSKSHNEKSKGEEENQYFLKLWDSKENMQASSKGIKIELTSTPPRKLLKFSC